MNIDFLFLFKDKIFQYKNKKRILIVLMFFLTLAPSLFLFSKYQKSQQKLKNLESSPQDEVTRIIKEIGKLIQLPEDETPTIATVTDREKLASQPFFANAKNGDKVIIYSNARKAILYDPAAKKIIDVAPLNINTITPTPFGPTPSPKPVSFILLNGTATIGLTRQYESELRQKIANFTVLSRDNALKKDYQNTLLVDLNNDQAEEAKNLAEKLEISLSSIPEGEITSGSADFLIITGADLVPSPQIPTPSP